MSMHISGSGEKVVLYERIKFLEIAIEVANEDEESEAIASKLEAELQQYKDRYESADGSVLMDASGKFELKMRAKMYIQMIRDSSAQKTENRT
ncbi:hypothetical protein [Aliiglaciecola sp. M165]|uniref:hypothetical protein n=1 Tax=Aliiglaciecola sp. M165 TaxID=2593649 RepID=UPI00117E9826|nr:hypothetical protein [Aliiglaciecola sp. M165]TRY29793.1 hypothetical protein FM019_16615 [Aliiglaciecola sp. M165]